MFLRMTTLKKLMKKAFNAGKLTVGMSEDGLFMDCESFYVWLSKYTVQNKVKAAIIELAGELPTEGNAFTAEKGGNQTCIPMNDIWDKNKRLANADKRYVITPILFDNSDVYRFLQQAGTVNMKAINEIFIDLIDRSEIDYMNGEDEVSGPFASEDGGMFYFTTDLCVLGVSETTLYRGLSRKVRSTIAKVDFEGDYSGWENE